MTLYFDYNATTPLAPEVLDAMLPYLSGNFANPSSLHLPGRMAREGIERARDQVADFLNAHPSQIVFTSGGTEANNLAIKGVVKGMAISQLFVSAIEHPSVYEIANYFKGALSVNYLGVDALGYINQSQLPDLSLSPSLVSVMYANNESGVIQDVKAIADLVRQAGHIFHTDAVQAVGKCSVDYEELGAHLMTLSSHKIYGPKGVGALVYDKSLDIEPLVHGGAQENGLRSGTENVAAIVGFGHAAELAKKNELENQEKLKALRDYFEEKLKELVGVIIFSENAKRLVNTTYFSVLGVDGETLLMQLDEQGISVTSGSACSSKTGNPSHVLLAMGTDEEVARSAIRVSFGLQNTKADVDILIKVLNTRIESLVTA